MKETYIADFKVDDEVVDFFMIKAMAVKVGSNNKTYLDLTLGDKTGDIAAKRWDLTDDEVAIAKQYHQNDIIEIRGIVTEWNGGKQLKVKRMRKASEKDQIRMEDFVKAAPEEPEEMYAWILKEAKAIGDEDLRNITVKNLEDNKERWLYYPAASKNHHAELAGLLWHVKRMLMTGKRVCEVYPMLDPDWVTCGVILHDVQKMNEINANELGISDGYSMEGQLLGHLVMGVRELDRQMTEMGVDREKAVMVEHMILSHHYEPEFGSPKKPLFPEAEILHYLDVIDARMYDMEEALKNTEPGTFSEGVWTLEKRKLYKRREQTEDAK